MALPMTVTQTLSALSKWHVRVIEYPGWKTRGRPGGIKDARGIVIHHTGSMAQSDDYLHFLFITGRPDEGIPGPLCNVSTDMDGDLHLGAIGRANHAGAGSLSTLNHVRNEDYNGYAAEIQPGPDIINGNDWYYGNEIRYNGAQPMTDAAYRTAILHAAAICDFYGWSALSVIGHKEHTRRKDDPGHCPMNKFRTDLATVLKIGPDVEWTGRVPHAPATTGTPGSTPTPPAKEEDDVALTKAQEVSIAKAGWLADQFAQGAQVETDLDGIDEIQSVLPQLATKAEVDAVAASVAALTAAVNALAAKLPKAA